MLACAEVQVVAGLESGAAVAGQPRLFASCDPGALPARPRPEDAARSSGSADSGVVAELSCNVARSSAVRRSRSCAATRTAEVGPVSSREPSLDDPSPHDSGRRGTGESGGDGDGETGGVFKTSCSSGVPRTRTARERASRLPHDPDSRVARRMPSYTSSCPRNPSLGLIIGRRF